MTLASLRERISVPLEWIATRVASHPKIALVTWALSLVLVAWMF